MRDDDAHWYLVPEDKAEEFWEFVDNIDEDPEPPVGAEMIDGHPDDYTFEDPRRA